MTKHSKRDGDVQHAGRQPSSVTGRDGYIMMQALVYASEWLNTLPICWDEPSNRSDMDALLTDMAVPSFVKMLRWQARCKLANKILDNSDLVIVEANESIAQEEL